MAQGHSGHPLQRKTPPLWSFPGRGLSRTDGMGADASETRRETVTASAYMGLTGRRRCFTMCGPHPPRAETWVVRSSLAHLSLKCGRVCRWRPMHAISSGLLDFHSCVARARAGAEVGPSPWPASMVPQFMAKTSVVPKKRRGPAPTGKGLQVGERWHPSELSAIDAWIASSGDKTLTRAHAIRRLVAIGLRAKAK
jgi:hypothetical protein